MYGRFWEITSSSMNAGNLLFTVVPQKYRSFSHHLEVGPFPSKFFFSSILDPFLRYDEELGGPREVVDILKIDIVEFICDIFQVQVKSSHPLDIGDPPDAIDFCIFHLF